MIDIDQLVSLDVLILLMYINFVYETQPDYANVIDIGD